MLRILSVVLLILSALPAEAGQQRVRAREHFRWADIRADSSLPNASYFGLGSTINIWNEKPLDRAFGLALGFGAAKTGSPPAGTSGNLHLIQAGVEGKRFLHPGSGGLFGRLGVGTAWLRAKGTTGTKFGGGYYLGLGQEWLAGRVGITPELALRHLVLEGGGRVVAFTPSLGFHFYFFPGDQESLSTSRSK